MTAARCWPRHVERGKAYLDAGAPVVFVPAILTEDEIVTLVDAFGPQRLTTIAIPGTPSLARQQELGVARVSFGPLSQNVALTALQELVEEVQRGGGVPALDAHPELTAESSGATAPSTVQRTTRLSRAWPGCG